MRCGEAEEACMESKGFGTGFFLGGVSLMESPAEVVQSSRADLAICSERSDIGMKRAMRLVPHAWCSTDSRDARGKRSVCRFLCEGPEAWYQEEGLLPFVPVWSGPVCHSPLDRWCQGEPDSPLKPSQALVRTHQRTRSG